MSCDRNYAAFRGAVARDSALVAAFPNPAQAIEDITEIARRQAPARTPEHAGAYLQAEAKTIALFRAMKQLYDLDPPSHSQVIKGGVPLPKDDAMFGYAAAWDAIQACQSRQPLTGLAAEVRDQQRVNHDAEPDRVLGMPDPRITSPMAEGPRKALRRKVLNESGTFTQTYDQLMHIARGRRGATPIVSWETLDLLTDASHTILNDSHDAQAREWAEAMLTWADRRQKMVEMGVWDDVDTVGQALSRWLLLGERLPDGPPPPAPDIPTRDRSGYTTKDGYDADDVEDQGY